MNFRSKVLRIAHNLVKVLNWNLSEALKQAWKAYRLRKRMYEGAVNFIFKKVNGELREAYGTLNNIEHLLSGSNKFISDLLTFRYYDLESRGFRAFKIQNLETIKV